MGDQGPEIRVEPQIEIGRDKTEAKRSMFEVIVPILVATITVFGTISAAYISLHSQIKSNEDRLDTLSIVGLQIGKIEMSEFIDRGYTLATPRRDGEGRRFTRYVAFPREFSTPPEVLLALSELDVGNESHIRVLAFPGNISDRGFEINVQTWNQSTIHTVSIEWLAVQTARK